MKRLVLLFAAVAAASAPLAGTLPSAAQASGLSPAVADCNTHNGLTGHYSVAQLRTALATMPADIKEYTNCYDAIQQQLLAQLSGVKGKGGSGQGGGSFLPTPVIVILALVVVGGAGFAAYAYRQRHS